MATTIVRADVSFNTVYAAAQHEHTEWAHDIGKAKYLEGPLKEAAPEFAPYVAARIRGVIESADAANAVEAARLIRDATEEAVGAFAEIVLGMAQSEAPLDEGTLRGSGEVKTGRTVLH